MIKYSITAIFWFVLGGLCIIGGFIYGGTIIVLLGALLLSVGFRKKSNK